MTNSEMTRFRATLEPVPHGGQYVVVPAAKAAAPWASPAAAG